MAEAFTQFHCRQGIDDLAGKLIGTETVHAGVRPFGVHAGNRIALSVYPLLLARALKAKGVEPKFSMLVTINDIEPREYDHFLLQPQGEMACAEEISETVIAVRADLQYLASEFPQVEIDVRLSSEFVDAPAFQEVLEIVGKKEALGHFLTDEIMAMMQPSGGEFAGLVCTACRFPTRASAGEPCPFCGTEIVARGDNQWMYYIPLIAAKLATLRPDVMIIGGDYLTAQPEIGLFMKHRHPLDAVHSCRTMVTDAPIMVLTGPVLIAADGRKMSKSLQNLHSYRFEEIVEACSQSDRDQVSIEPQAASAGSELDPVVRSLLSSETAFQTNVLGADASALVAMRQPRVNPLALPANPDVGRKSVTLTAAGQRPVSALHFAQAASVGDRAVVFFHGGGLVTGTVEDEASFCQHLAAALDAHIFSIDYRLAPEHLYPSAHQDALTAYAAVVEQSGIYGIDPNRIAVSGASAGAGLAVTLCVARREAGLTLPAAQLLYYPALHPPGLTAAAELYGSGFGHSTALSKWYASQYLGGDDFMCSGLFPLLEENLTGLPPTVIASAGFDPARDDASLFEKRLLDDGVPVTHRCWERLTHGFLGYPRVVPDARTAIDLSIAALDCAF